MGLFDLFKKKPQEQEQPQQPNQEAAEVTEQELLADHSLEQLLIKSAKQPAYRPKLYRQLLTDSLVIIIQNDEMPPGEVALQQGANVQIITLNSGQIPVFTSRERIFDNGNIKGEIQFLQVKGEDLFRMAKGATFVLNPFSGHGKELIPDEVESMLDGSIFNDMPRKLVIEKDTEVLLGQPSIYPTAIVGELKTIFEKHPAVKAAHLGWIHDPASTVPPHYIFALDGDNFNELDPVMQEAGLTINAMGHNEIFDFVVIEKDSSIGEYFLTQTTPFYTKGR